MSMQWVRDRYKVPAKRGMYIEMYGHDGKLSVSGRIKSASYQLRVRGRHHIKGDPVEVETMYVHPTWNMVYYDKPGGEILKDCRTSDQGQTA